MLECACEEISHCRWRNLFEKGIELAHAKEQQVWHHMV